MNKRLASTALGVLCTAHVVSSQDKLDVTSEALRALVTVEDLLTGVQTLEDFATENGGDRGFGNGGHNATVDYIYDTLVALDYYDVVKQPFEEQFYYGNADAGTIGGVMFFPQPVDFSPPIDTFFDTVYYAANQGCDVEDFPASTVGHISVIARGNCTFAQKVTNAKAAGAIAVVLANDVSYSVRATLGGPGDWIPALMVDSFHLGMMPDGSTIYFSVNAIEERRVTYNVIAETRGGDKDNVLMLGAHSDSIGFGPGINDNGSGTIGILNVATHLAQFATNNAVRFAFWSASEFGKLGSYYYMNQLNTTASEVAKIRAYLNFDMIASPNWVYGVLDGDGSTYGLAGPEGSGAIEQGFHDFFASQNTSSVDMEINGLSDYQAFLENGVPSGGLFTGANVEKTEEEAAVFGGVPDKFYDVNYCVQYDTVEEMLREDAQYAFLFNVQAIADAVAKYATSFDLFSQGTSQRDGNSARDASSIHRRQAAPRQDPRPCFLISEKE
ncbi:hypothetical protein F4778DRAFT_793666 [Xylariomycetidae sp. FL2044]|nr:hypothetical protein F4778DRAFT_793666 [Xylariomycetidae sp. FL2044]